MTSLKNFYEGKYYEYLIQHPFRIQDVHSHIAKEILTGIQRYTGKSEDEIFQDFIFIYNQPSIQTIFSTMDRFWANETKKSDIAARILYNWYIKRCGVKIQREDIPAIGEVQFKPNYAFITPHNDFQSVLCFAWSQGYCLDFIEEGLDFKGYEVALNGGYADLLVKDKNGVYVIIELKTQKASKNAIEQVKQYIDLARVKWPNRTFRGIIVTNGIVEGTLELRKDPQYNISIVDASLENIRKKIYLFYLQKVLYSNQEHLKVLKEFRTQVITNISEIKQRIMVLEGERDRQRSS